MSGTPRRSGALLPVLAAVIVGAMAAVPLSQSAGADSVSTLNAKAKTIAQDLVQEQLQISAYQQQYSVASARLADDQRAISLTQHQISIDARLISQRRNAVRRLAALTYVLNGTVSSTSGMALLAENVKTVQSTNEYATISVGDINDALDELHTAQAADQA